MESSFTTKYTLLITVLVASMTAAMAMFFIVERGIEPNSTSKQVEKLDYLIKKIENISNLQEEVDRLKK